MKYLLILSLSIVISFAQTKYGYGNIDMHGGKKESLIQEKGSHFSNKSIGLSNALDKKKKKVEKKEKVKTNK